MKVILLAAMSRDRVIGHSGACERCSGSGYEPTGQGALCGNCLGEYTDPPKRIDVPPEVESWIEQRTRDACVLHGRIAWEYLPESSPLRRWREHIVLTSDVSDSPPGPRECLRAASMADAIGWASQQRKDLCVLGGERTYRSAIPFADELDLQILDPYVEGDRLFPEARALLASVSCIAFGEHAFSLQAYGNDLNLGVQRELWRRI